MGIEEIVENASTGSFHNLEGGLKLWKNTDNFNILEEHEWIEVFLSEWYYKEYMLMKLKFIFT